MSEPENNLIYNSISIFASIKKQYTGISSLKYKAQEGLINRIRDELINLE